LEGGAFRKGQGEKGLERGREVQGALLRGGVVRLTFSERRNYQAGRG